MCKHQKKCPGLKGSKTDLNRVCNTCFIAFGNMKMTKKQQELVRTTLDKVIEKPLVEKAKVAFFPNANGNDYVAQCFEANDVLHAILETKRRVDLYWSSTQKDRGYLFTKKEIHQIIKEVFGETNIK